MLDWLESFLVKMVLIIASVATLSILAWTGAVTAGRLLAYLVP